MRHRHFGLRSTATHPVDPQVAVYRQLLDNANAQLQGQIAQLQKELAAEKAKSTTTTREPPNAQQIPQPSPNDGGSSAQPPVRQEGGSPH